MHTSTWIWTFVGIYITIGFAFVYTELVTSQLRRFPTKLKITSFGEIVLVALFWVFITPQRFYNVVRRILGEQDQTIFELKSALKDAQQETKGYRRESNALMLKVRELEDLLAEVEPYIDWREVTDELDGKWCESWADALDEAHARADRRDGLKGDDRYTPTDRWWRQGLMD